jgi:hypothetical protein
MFGREEKKTERRPQPPVAAPAAPAAPAARIETVIGPNAHFRGNLISEGGIRIDGIFEGNIETTGNLVIGESAKVIADIRANNISISGAVKGNITGQPGGGSGDGPGLGRPDRHLSPGQRRGLSAGADDDARRH